jgi:hypothetical protein
MNQSDLQARKAALEAELAQVDHQLASPTVEPISSLRIQCSERDQDFMELEQKRDGHVRSFQRVSAGHYIGIRIDDLKVVSDWYARAAANVWGVESPLSAEDRTAFLADGVELEDEDTEDYTLTVKPIGTKSLRLYTRDRDDYDDVTVDLDPDSMRRLRDLINLRLGEPVRAVAVAPDVSFPRNAERIFPCNQFPSDKLSITNIGSGKVTIANTVIKTAGRRSHAAIQLSAEDTEMLRNMLNAMER